MEWSRRRERASQLFSHLWNWGIGHLSFQELVHQGLQRGDARFDRALPLLQERQRKLGDLLTLGCLACFPGKPVSGSAPHQTRGEWGTNRPQMQVPFRLQAQGGVAAERAQEEERLHPTTQERGANGHAGWLPVGDAPHSHM
jgi:hypothetical protein